MAGQQFLADLREAVDRARVNRRQPGCAEDRFPHQQLSHILHNGIYLGMSIRRGHTAVLLGFWHHQRLSHGTERGYPRNQGG